MADLIPCAVAFFIGVLIGSCTISFFVGIAEACEDCLIRKQAVAEACPYKVEPEASEAYQQLSFTHLEDLPKHEPIRRKTHAPQNKKYN